MNTFTTISHALADPTRIRLLAACLEKERCVCQLVELIDLSNASISKHLSVLKGSGLLESRREGRWVHYQTPPSPTPAVRDALALVRAHALKGEQIAQDAQRLQRIDEINPCDLARMQREGCCCIPK
jgi:DNA-binding transcriptional ArsR family regulator